MAKHAYLVKVLVQTVWVVIDDETGVAKEEADGGSWVPASEWAAFPARHAADFAALQDAIATEPKLDSISMNGKEGSNA